MRAPRSAIDMPRLRLASIVAVAVAATVTTLALPPIAQDYAYHAFADTRTIAGIPNFWNVASNAAFVAVGVAGLGWLARHGRSTPGGPLGARWEVAAASTFAAGVLLTGLGSMFYHLAPDHDRLVWDRLPMTSIFMSLFALVIGDRIGPASGRWLLVPLLLTGVASVFAWHLSEVAGRGDLRLYALVQFLPLMVVPLLLLLMPARFSGAAWLWAALGLNAIGKAAELADATILVVSGWISGHTLKHFVMASATGLILIMIAVRRPR
jgi:hypothetical protein